MLARRTATLMVSAAVVLMTAGAAQADPVTDFEMPFPCAEAWSASTRDSHSPSPYAVDWNRADDVNDPVVASASGTVTTADSVDDSGYGRWVVIDHGNNEKSLYAHLDTVTVVAGQRVDQGALIGSVGSTGNSSGPHLHYEQRLGSTVVAPFFHQLRAVFGTALKSQNCVDVPVSALDWTGDKIADVSIFRRTSPGVFWIQRPGASSLVRSYGISTDTPLIGDWEGDGVPNVGIRRPASSTFWLLDAAGRASGITYGWPSDTPVVGNWHGSARWEVGIWRPLTATFWLRSETGVSSTVKLGDPNDLPVTGDWDGDGITDLGVYDQATATYTLRKVDAQGIVWVATVAFGSPGDLPVTGDWDGNLRTDLGTWTPSTGTFNRRLAPVVNGDVTGVSSVRYGNPRR